MTLDANTSSRKLDHLRICSETNPNAGSPGFEDVRLVHNALPECNFDSIDLSVNFLGKKLSSPLFISAMTGGHPETTEVNRVLGCAAEKYGLAMGVGSQRAALEDPKLADSFRIVRDVAPHAFLCGNLGAVQLVTHGMDWVESVIDMIDADALCIHLNFLQEVIQPEGDRNAIGCLDAISQACKETKIPIIVKETGSGISSEVAARLFDVGVSAIDVGGYGGTSWAKIEGIRAQKQKTAGDKSLTGLGNTFIEWGIPTAVSVFEVAKVSKGPVIATGGLKTGLDIAKGIALGATLGGMALSLLGPAFAGEDELGYAIDKIHTELSAAMFLCGSQDIPSQQKARYYLTGDVRQMIRT